jgi:hypothetical protein
MKGNTHGLIMLLSQNCPGETEEYYRKQKVTQYCWSLGQHLNLGPLESHSSHTAFQILTENVQNTSKRDFYL